MDSKISGISGIATNAILDPKIVRPRILKIAVNLHLPWLSMPITLIPIDIRTNPIKILPLFETFSVNFIDIGIINPNIIDTKTTPKPIKAGENPSSAKSVEIKGKLPDIEKKKKN